MPAIFSNKNPAARPPFLQITNIAKPKSAIMKDAYLKGPPGRPFNNTKVISVVLSSCICGKNVSLAPQSSIASKCALLTALFAEVSHFFPRFLFLLAAFLESSLSMSKSSGWLPRGFPDRTLHLPPYCREICWCPVAR